MSDDFPEEPAPRSLSQEDRDAVVDVLCVRNTEFRRPDAPIDLGDELRWAPDLIASTTVVHVEFDERPSRAFSRRLRAAAAAGWEIVVATLSEPVSIEMLDLLQELEAAPIELQLGDDGAWRADPWKSVADWVARANMALRPDETRQLVARCLALADDATRSNHARGHAYEEALCLLFSQVSWLKVVEHAYNNQTEEIDIVLQVTGASDYARLAGGPLAIATAKNEAKALGSATVKYLEGQMNNRRGRCKLGFACARKGVSKPAESEILGLRRSELVIVPVGSEQFEKLLVEADRIDECLAQMVIEATIS